MKQILIILFLLSFCSSSFGFNISNDGGGELTQYIDRFLLINENKDIVKVIISGSCFSACTLFIGIIDKEKICVKEDTMFGFHSASTVSDNKLSFSLSGSRLMWLFYSEEVRKKLIDRGWDGSTPHPNFIMIKGTELYPLCNKL